MTDNKTPYFNIFEWKAPVFTIEEILREIKRQNILGKEIKNIRIIGYYSRNNKWEVKNDLIYNLFKAGTPRKCILRKKNYDDFTVDISFSASEPIIIEFTDNSTFEFLPLNGQKARIGYNSISTDIQDGTNHNFESLEQRLDINFNGTKLQDIEIKTESINRISHKINNKNKYIKIKEHFDRTSISYIFILSNKNSIHSIDLMINMKPFCNSFNVSFRQYSLYPSNTCTLSELLKRLSNKITIPLIDGTGAGFRISAIADDSSPEKENNILNEEYGIFIDEDLYQLLLADIFSKHFILSDQDDDFYYEKFDWYGDNCYTFTSMKSVIHDIKEEIVNIYNHKSKLNFKEIENYFKNYELNIYGIKDENYTININCEDIIIDFYERFCRYYENFMNAAKSGKIYVSGP